MVEDLGFRVWGSRVLRLERLESNNSQAPKGSGFGIRGVRGGDLLAGCKGEHLSVSLFRALSLARARTVSLSIYPPFSFSLSSLSLLCVSFSLRSVSLALSWPSIRGPARVWCATKLDRRLVKNYLFRVRPKRTLSLGFADSELLSIKRAHTRF